MLAPMARGRDDTKGSHRLLEHAPGTTGSSADWGYSRLREPSNTLRVNFIAGEVSGLAGPRTDIQTYRIRFQFVVGDAPVCSCMPRNGRLP